MFDTHCHLWFKHFSGEVPQVIERAREARVHTLICVGCDEPSSRQSVDLAGRFENVYVVVGLHPNDDRFWEGERTMKWMRELIGSSSRVVGVGETGIDYYRGADKAEIQKEMLKAQCIVAQEFDLPVIVHLRQGKLPKSASSELSEVERDCLRVLDEVGMEPGKVLFHCFSGDRLMLQEVLKRNWMISFSGTVTYPTALELQQVAKECPLDRMVFETDCPFLPPQSHRGQRNEPAYVVETAQFVADLRQMRYEDLVGATDANARRIFRLPENENKLQC